MSYGASLVFDQNQATPALATWTFHLTNTSDGSNATGKTPVLTQSVNGLAFGATAATITEIANGFYKCVFVAADLAVLGELQTLILVTGCDTLRVGHSIKAPSTNAAAIATLQTSVNTLTTDVNALTTKSLKPRVITLGHLAANGSTVGVDIIKAYQTVVTVTGTFGSGSAQVQTCADPTLVSPVWLNSGGALTSNGSVTVSGPATAVRVTLSGATSPSLNVTALAQDFA